MITNNEKSTRYHDFLHCFLAATLSPKRNGTMSWPQDSIRESLLWPQSTRLQVWLTPLTAWEVVFSPPLLPTATTLPTLSTGESLSSKSMRSRDLTATPTSTVWTSPETRAAPWSESGTPLLRPLFKPRQWTATSLECSALLSPRKHQDKLRRPATPKLPTRSSLERRWWRLCNLLFKSPISRSSSKFCKYSSVFFSFYISKY